MRVLKLFNSANSAAKIVVDVSKVSLSIASETTSKTFEAASNSLSKASSSMRVADKGLKLILGVVKISQAIRVKKALQKGIVNGNCVRVLIKLFREKPEMLKNVAPEIYRKLLQGRVVTTSFVHEALLESQNTLKKSLILLSVCIVGIVISVLSIIFTGGVLGIVLASLGIASSLVLAGFDMSDLINKLQNSLFLSKRDLIVNIITIILGVLALVASVIFAPTEAVAIGSALICGAMIASPAASMTYLKVKEQKLKEAKRAQSFYGRCISSLKEKVTQIKGVAERTVSKTQMAFYRAI